MSTIEKLPCRRACRRTLAAGVMLLCLCYDAFGANWSGWLGPTRDGITPENSNWTDDRAPKRLWKASVGIGSTSPIIFEGKVYTMGWHGRRRHGRNPAGKDVVYCFDARSGKQLWSQTRRCLYQGRLRAGDLHQYGGPCATPVIDPKTKLLYTVSIDGDLRCLDITEKGRQVWELNFYDKYDVKKRPFVGRSWNDYGYTSAPLICDDVLIMEVGDDEGTLMAFDKKTGERRWTSDCDEPAGHSGGPVRIDVDGIPCVATLALRKVIVVRVDKGHEGETVAEYPWATDFACNIATPAVDGDRLVITSDYNMNQTHLLEISREGAKPVWKSKYYAKVSSPVIYKDRVYLVDGSVKCLELATGKLLWKGGSFGHGNCLVAAGDDRLIVFGNRKLVLLDASGETGDYRELGRLRGIVRDTCYPHVALSDGILCCKDKGGMLVCFSVGR